MAEGDLVISYERHDALDHFYLSAGKIFQNKYGHFHHEDMIGKPFGSKIFSRTSRGWIYTLEPSPELWGTALNVSRHIVYLPVHPSQYFKLITSSIAWNFTRNLMSVSTPLADTHPNRQ